MSSPFIEEAVGQALRTLGVALRTPIMTVSGSVQIAMGSDDIEEVRSQLGAVSTAADNLSAIVDDLLDAAELAAGTLQFHPVPFRLPDTIQEAAKAVAPVAADRNIELSVHGLTALPTDLVGDPSRLRQVLSHFIANAVAWTNHGRVQVGAQVLKQDLRSVSVRFAIRDTSSGMTPEELEEAFLPFGNVGPGVSVLGVAIARLVIELMGGEVEVESRPGEGTVVGFTLDFPRAAGPEVTPITPSSWVMVIAASETARLLTDVLRHGQFDPVGFPSTAVAAAAAAMSDRPGEVPGAVILAPVAKPFDAAEHFLANPTLGSVPLLLVAPNGQRGDGSRCATLGVAGYLPRPISPIDLIEATRELVERGSSNGPLVNRHWLLERRRKLDVLVVDDSPTGRAVIIRSLERLGHRARGAATGVEALETIEKASPDIVIMDMEMPEMDGVEATMLLRARERGARIPIVGLSAHASQKDKEMCLAAGMDAHLSKPFQITELQMAIDRLGGQPG